MRFEFADNLNPEISDDNDMNHLGSWSGIDTEQKERLKILVIEDNDFDFQAMKDTLLSLSGYDAQIERARTLLEARSAALKGSYDVVLIDFCIGSDTGVLAMHEFGGQTSESALILVSGMSGREIQQIALKAGALACLSKNQLNPSLLGSTITSAIHNHRVQRRLQKSVHELEQEASSKQALYANMSHDLKTPLNAILGYAEIIAENSTGLPASKQHQDHANKIRSGGLHLLEVINNLVLHSSDFDTMVDRNNETVELNKIVQRATDLVFILAANKAIDLQLVMPQSELYVRGQSSQITQAIVNILSNAIKYTYEGGSIFVEVTAMDGLNRVKVTDNGIGMSEADIEIAKTPFGRCKLPPHLSQEGTGLGLSIVEKIVASHNGSLIISSNPGVGTVVDLKFPSVY